MSVTAPSPVLAGSRVRRVSRVRLWRNTAWFIAGFAFFYLEPLAIGPTNFASVWKIAALAAVVALMISDHRFRQVPALAVIGGAFAGVACLNPSLLIDPLGTFAYALKALYIPAILVVLTGLHRARGLTPEGLLGAARLISVFVVLSALPFLAGLIEPLATGGYDLSLFGTDGTGFTGVFFSSHAASIVMSASAVILAHASKQAPTLWRALWYGALSVLALYCIYITFARTGYVLSMAGLIVVLGLPMKVWKLALGIPLAAFAVLLAVDSVVENETLMMRLRGENVHTIASGKGGDVTSGRFRFWVAATDSYAQGNPLELLTGVGEYNGKEMIQERVGLRIGSHNEFFDALLFTGALGLALLVLFSVFLLRMALYAAPDEEVGGLVLALTMAYGLQLLLQGERLFLSELLMMLVVMAGVLSVNRRRLLASAAAASAARVGGGAA